MITYKKLMVALILSLMLTSCLSKKPVPISDNNLADIKNPEVPTLTIETVRLEETKKNIEQKIDDIKSCAVTIEEKSDEIIKDNPQITQAPEIKREAIDIKETSDKAKSDIRIIEELTNALFLKERNLEDLKVRLNELREHYDMLVAIKNSEYKELERKIEDERRQSADEKYKTLRRVWFAISSASALALIAGIVLIVLGNKSLGSSLAIGATACIFVSVFFATHIQIVAWVGGILLGIALLWVCWIIYKNRKVFEQLIVSAQIMKKNNWDTETIEKVEAIQDNNTKKIVQKVKDKARENGKNNL